uniref:Uncharacterized protein n=1 Tax=Nelumbo nucifera TaxID=4432 RepID=A0A822XY49_NELNU|nr:TPA_asm: hypothetical protein HUJ06_026744 [Nelumbo nucifera]
MSTTNRSTMSMPRTQTTTLVATPLRGRYDLRWKSVMVPAAFVVGWSRLPPDLRRSVFVATAVGDDGSLLSGTELSEK